MAWKPDGYTSVAPYLVVDGAQRTIDMLNRYELAVPALLQAAAKGEVRTPLFNLPFVTTGRFLAG